MFIEKKSHEKSLYRVILVALNSILFNLPCFLLCFIFVPGFVVHFGVYVFQHIDICIKNVFDCFYKKP